jgi:hypothetical protein
MQTSQVGMQSLNGFILTRNTDGHPALRFLLGLRTYSGHCALDKTLATYHSWSWRVMLKSSWLRERVR